MPRTYKTPIDVQPRKVYNKDKVTAAYEAVISKTLTQKEACLKYGVATSTLSDKITGKRALNSNRGRSTALSPSTEAEIAIAIMYAASWGFPLEKTEIPRLVERYLISNDIIIPIFKEGTLPGPDWTDSFLKRNVNLSLRMANNIKRARAKISPLLIDEFFNEITPYLKDVHPDNFFNYDESNLSDDPGLKKMIFKRGVKYPDNVINHTKSSISFMMCVSASGIILPPYIVYKAKELHQSWTVPIYGRPFCEKRCCSNGIQYAVSKSGWFCMQTFESWFFKTFLPHVKYIEAPKILFGDNLSSHFTPKVLEACQEYNIRFICLPPNSTHILQPLDVSYFGPLKNCWKGLLRDWKKKNPNVNVLAKSTFPFVLAALFGNMENQKQNVISGFAGCGLYPLNRERVKRKLPLDLNTSTSNDSGISAMPIGAAAESLLTFMQQQRGFSPNVQAGPSGLPGIKESMPQGRGRGRRDGLLIIPGKNNFSSLLQLTNIKLQIHCMIIMLYKTYR